MNHTRRIDVNAGPQRDIDWLVACYAHLIPFNTANVTGARLAALIRANYHTGTAGAGPINETAARIAETLPGSFARVGEVRSYTHEEPTR